MQTVETHFRQATNLGSRQIESFGYDPLRKTLQVTFTSGARYEYDEIPAQVAGQLFAAESVGAAFNLLVKQVGYTYRKLEMEDVCK